MDHGRFGPPGLLGGRDGAPNEVIVSRQGGEYVSPHLSKDEDIRVVAGDTVTVRTPGGGGYGDPWLRDPMLVARDVSRGYLAAADARADYGVVLTAGIRLLSTAAPPTICVAVVAPESISGLRRRLDSKTGFAVCLPRAMSRNTTVVQSGARWCNIYAWANQRDLFVKACQFRLTLPDK